MSENEKEASLSVRTFREIKVILGMWLHNQQCTCKKWEEKFRDCPWCCTEEVLFKLNKECPDNFGDLNLLETTNGTK